MEEDTKTVAVEVKILGYQFRLFAQHIHKEPRNLLLDDHLFDFNPPRLPEPPEPPEPPNPN